MILRRWHEPWHNGGVILLRKIYSRWIQFSSVQFSSVQFSSVQFSSVQFSSVQFSSVQFSSVQFSSVQFSSVQFSSVQFSSVQFSSVQFSSVQFSSVQFSSVQFSSVQFSSVQFSSVQFSSVIRAQLFLHLSIADFPLYIDYAEMKQSFQYGINHIESFKIGEDYFIAIVRTLPTPKVCTPTEVMLLNRTNGQYGTYQFLSPALGSRFKSFKKDKEIYLFLENAENDCMPKGNEFFLVCFLNTSLSACVPDTG